MREVDRLYSIKVMNDQQMAIRLKIETYNQHGEKQTTDQPIDKVNNYNQETITNNQNQNEEEMETSEDKPNQDKPDSNFENEINEVNTRQDIEKKNTPDGIHTPNSYHISKNR